MTLGVLRAVEARERIAGKAGLRDVLECGHDVPYDGYPHASRRCKECRPDEPMPTEDDLEQEQLW